MEKITIPDNVLMALEDAIYKAIQDRIDNDPDVEDTYLHIEAVNGKFTVRVMYLEESNACQPNDDIALLNLMYNATGSEANPEWHPEEAAISTYVDRFKEMVVLYHCNN